MKKAVFESEASIIEDLKNPSLLRVRFVYTDDKPNANGQGIEQEDFASLALSALGMPIKMRFTGKGVESHKGSITIGHITSVEEEEEDGVHKLVANGVVWADEYPEEADYLRKSFAEKKAPGISWELTHKTTIIRDGINWLKGIAAKAATFVGNPAYGARTALLALASDASLSNEELAQGMTALANEISKEPIKGGNNVEEELKKEIERLKAELLTKQTELETALSGAKASTDKLSEAEAKITAHEEVIAAYKRTSLIEDRSKKLVEAGLTLDTEAEKLEKKQAFIASLSEEAFTEYVADLAAVKSAAVAAAPKDASASRRDGGIPKPGNSGNGHQPTSITDLKSRMKAYARSTGEEE